MNGNPTRPNYLVFDRTDASCPLFVVTRAVATVPLAAYDHAASADRWLRTLARCDAAWVEEAVDAFDGAAHAHPERTGYATPLRRLRVLPPDLRAWHEN